MFNPLEFQVTATDKLAETFVNLWKKSGRQLPLVFKAPTGSGKTFMIANFVRNLNKLPNWDENKAFVWITFSDDIAIQSRDKFLEYFENTLENNLLTVNDINKGKLAKNEILFLNWQKVVSKAAENRVLRRPEDPKMGKESGKYFEDFIDNTHNEKREIILIIDEAHIHAATSLAQEIIDYIDPKIIIHITATPNSDIELASRRIDSFVEVERQKVIDEGLIKEKILVQTEEDLKKYGKKDTDEVLLDLGYNRKKELEEEFKQLKKNINPLVLIQLPNDDKKLLERGEKSKKDVVLEYLTKKGVNPSKIAMWFDGIWQNMEFIKEKDSEVDYLLFKQAAGTGWDCPRAHVLVMFREITSDTFYIQTVGRILRMPEPENKEDYKNNSNLRTGFLYTNYERNKVNAKWNELSQNKPEIYVALRKKGINNIQLVSDYVSRLEYGDLSNSAKFQASFLKSMNHYYGIIADDMLNGKASKKILDTGVELDPKIPNEFIVNAKFEDFDQLGYDFKKEGKEVQLEASINDVEKTFNYCCYKVLKEQTEDEAKISNIARSWSPLKSAVRIWLKGITGDDSERYYRIFVSDIQKDAASKFRPAITQALKDYKPTLKKIIEEKRKVREEKEATIFTIREEYWFTEDYEDTNCKLCALDKGYFLKVYLGKINESKFREYINSKVKEIEWWFKNADYGKEYYSIRYWNSKESAFRLFYPDWIIRFKDGRIGIFDTKAGETAERENVKDKAKALSKKIQLLGKKYVGGIVVFENGIWYYSDADDYEYTHGKLNKDWKPFEKLL